jgi:hypothetical protein
MWYSGVLQSFTLLNQCLEFNETLRDSLLIHSIVHFLFIMSRLRTKGDILFLSDFFSSAASASSSASSQRSLSGP